MLPNNIESLVALVESGASGDAGAEALLLLLENTSESEHIVTALSRVRPDMVTDAALQARVAKLLQDTNAYDLLQTWQAAATPADNDGSSKIVSLHGDVKSPTDIARQYGQVVTFEDVGG